MSALKLPPAYHLPGLEFVASPYLIGCKTGVKRGNRVLVSPAFYDLLVHASGDAEVEALLKSLKVFDADLVPPPFPTFG